MAKKPKHDTQNKKNTSLRLDAKKLKQLKLIALEEDTSVQQIIEKLIDGYLAKQKRKKP